MRRCRIESLAVSPPRKSLLRQSAMEHAVAAGRACLKGSRYHPADVRVLINTGVHRDDHVCEPAIAAYVQHKLGINLEFQGRRTLAFDLLNGACGMLNGVQVLASLLLAGDAHAGMVVSSEANSDRDPDPSYPYPPSGAAALLDLAPREGQGFGSFAFHTREEHAHLFTSVVSLAVKRGKLKLQRDAALEDAWLGCAKAAVDEVLEKDGLRREDLDVVVPAQVSPGFLAKLPAALGLAREKIADFTDRLPDTHSTSMFLALDQAQRSGAAAPGKRALLLAVGSGVTAGAATYRL